MNETLLTPAVADTATAPAGPDDRNRARRPGPSPSNPMPAEAAVIAVTATPWPNADGVYAGDMLYAAALWPSALAAGLHRFGQGPGLMETFVTMDPRELADWIARKTPRPPRS